MTSYILTLEEVDKLILGMDHILHQ